MTHGIQQLGWQDANMMQRSEMDIDEHGDQEAARQNGYGSNMQNPGQMSWLPQAVFVQAYSAPWSLEALAQSQHHLPAQPTPWQQPQAIFHPGNGNWPVVHPCQQQPPPSPLCLGFLGINLGYPGLQQLHANPPLYFVHGFLTDAECDALVLAADGFMTVSPVVGQGAGEVSASRTSSSCYLAREDLPAVVRKVSALTLKPPEHMELPQVGRYFPSQHYSQHFDAFDLSTEDGRRFASNGGQRVCTVLIYLNHVTQGGHTSFPKLGLSVRPQKGMACVFFPASVDGQLDVNALHAAEPAVDVKWVSQIWIRQGTYNGVPTRRITPI